MQFKGTPQFPPGVLDKAIARQGGFWNAFTFLDWTTYFETMPADKIDLALRLEADRMLNSVFDPEEVDRERTVIISERQGNENEPLFRLGEELQAAAFRVHNYHHQVIGDMTDLENMERDDLYSHYRTYYTPNNAVLAVAGDFRTEQMLERLRQLYEHIPARDTPPRYSRNEPAQRGQRQVTVEGPGETTYIQAAYHTPVASHPDFFPLMVMDSLLSGPSAINILGGGLSNKTSRLYRALVETELAVSVSGGLQATIDPYLHTITIIVHPQSSAEPAVAALDQEIQRLQEIAPSNQEVARAVKQARALFAYGNERITSQAFWLGLSEMFASYDWYTNYLDTLATVTPDDVQRVAQTYLRPQNRTMGIYLPCGDQGEDV
jgi:zinc protease